MLAAKLFVIFAYAVATISGTSLFFFINFDLFTEKFL